MLSNKQQFYRKTGIDLLGDVPWGSHFCLFYETEEDLMDILVPYFKAGLRNNEFCIWINSYPLSTKEAESTLRKFLPGFDRYLQKEQIQILPHSEWYLKNGKFNLQRVLKGKINKLNLALKAGFDGVRITGNTAWLEKIDWENFSDYERQINTTISKYRAVAICTYCLDKCSASEIVDIVSNHESALIRRQGKWELIESTSQRRAQRKLLAYQKRLRDLASEMSLAEERQRRRIAIELHDQVTQNLILFKINLGKLREKELPGESVKSLDEIYKHLDQIIHNMRSLTFDLGSPTLYELGLEAAVREYLNEEIQQKHGLKTIFEDDAQPKPLDDDVCVLLYHAVRELLINVVKHAKARYVKVSFSKDNDHIRINVVDDGIGFKPPSEGFGLGKTAGFGLFSIRERLSYLGGTANIESRPGHGTAVTLRAPIKDEKVGLIGDYYEHKNFNSR
jgi:signal transduction histidine kinase